jgi:pSer/pThr/pTyr-binding forkhead associated (FHA) protein
MSLNAKLVVVGGDVKTTEINLKLPSTIGRGRGTSIVLPHPLVSRQHCELFEADGQLMVRDLGSLNGTFVNNERITESPLAPDELLTVGTVTFRAVYETEERPPTGPGPKRKPAASDSTLPAPKGAKAAASPKPAIARDAESDSGPLEFNFDQPLLPVDTAPPAKGGGPSQPTERLDKTVAQEKKTKPAPPEAASKSAKRPAQPAPSKTPSADSKWDEEAEPGEKVPSASDDDLKDFLESLGDDEK